MVDAAAIQHKMHRLSKAGRLRVVDLFAGCGGFSLGFERSGMEICGAVEQDPVACQSHAINFFQGNRPQIVEQHAQPHDITTTDPEDFIREIGIAGKVRNAVDILVGGPPCQAFARIGRAKLRDVSSNPNAHRDDSRANLFLDFLRFVEALSPLGVVVENVPDMMNHGGDNVVANMCGKLEKLGYSCRYTLLNAAHFGVPQFRERVFIFAIHKALGVAPQFPKPTHQLALPSGYASSRAVAMKTIVARGQPCDWYADLPAPRPDAPMAVSCHEALADLPAIKTHLTNGKTHGVRLFNQIVRYPRRKKLSEYAAMMRNWNGYANAIGIRDHVIRYLPRDYETFRRMNPGDQYPEAYQVAMNRLEEQLGTFNGHAPRKNSQAYKLLLKNTVPPYDPEKFPNKWWKLVPEKPSKTLTAHIGKDTYSHIHYDSEQARTISVREAARLQSFPDGFVFAGAMNAAFRQIGNAVPPLVALAIARQLKRQLRAACRS